MIIMTKVMNHFAVLFVIAVSCALAAPPRFEKVSGHFFCLAMKEGGLNVGAVVANDGVLLINPPAEPELAAVLTALKRVSPRPVRWVVSTDYRLAQSADAAIWTEQSVTVLGAKELWKLMSSASEAEGRPAKPDG